MSATSATPRKKAKNSKTGSPQKHPQVSFRELLIQATRIAVTDDIQQSAVMIERKINANLKHTLEAFLLKSAVIEQVLMERLGITEAELQDRLLNEEDRIEGYFVTETLGATPGNFVRLEVTGVSEDEAKEGIQRIKIKSLLANPPELNNDFEAAILGMKAGDTRRVKIIIQDKERVYDVLMKRVSIKKADEVPAGAVNEEAKASPESETPQN